MAFRETTLIVGREGFELALRRPERPLFPPPNPAVRGLPSARHKGERSLVVLTATGTVTLRRRYFRSRATGGSRPVEGPKINCTRSSAGALDRTLRHSDTEQEGPTEAMCRNLPLRLKRTGVEWDPASAAAVMNLVALREPGRRHAW